MAGELRVESSAATQPQKNGSREMFDTSSSHRRDDAEVGNVGSDRLSDRVLDEQMTWW
jgi:hypothetical protein